MFKLINYSLITVLLVATFADSHIRNRLLSVYCTWWCPVASCSIAEHQRWRRLGSPTVAHCNWETSGWCVSDDRRHCLDGILDKGHRSTARYDWAVLFSERKMIVARLNCLDWRRNVCP